MVVKRPRGKRVKTGSELEEGFWMWLKAQKMEAGWEREYRFHPTRQWRFDFAHPEWLIAVECEGLRRDGKGRHQSFLGFTGDCRKYNAAAELGWLVLRCTRPMLESLEIYESIKAASRARRVASAMISAGETPSWLASRS